MKVHIPNSAFLGNIESFTQHFDPDDELNLEITANPNWISVHPMVISMIIALCQEVRNNNGNILDDKITAKSRPYLVRMGLLDAINENHGFSIDKHESAGRFIPARNIFTSDDLSEFIVDMVPLLHTTVEQAYPIKYVISELVRNVIEHARSNVGAIVCAQYFKKSNRISIGVADRGIGIFGGISQSYSPKSSYEAIDLALQPGVTGTTNKIGGTELNAGAGLFFTKSIAKVSRDFFILYSGNSLFKLLKTKPEYYVQLYPDPKLDRARFKNGNIPRWNGTAVGIDISLDVNQDFDNLLSLIRDAYQLDVKRAKKGKYKKPKFI